MFRFNQVLSEESVEELGFELIFQWTSTMGGHLAIVRDGFVIARGIYTGGKACNVMLKVVY